MTHCELLRDRMPDILRGDGQWDAEESAHLRTCADCAAEWRLVRAGAGLGGSVSIDTERVARSVVARLREEPSQAVIARIPWRGAALGLTAIAAALLLVVGYHRTRDGQATPTGDTVAMAILPELQVLDTVQLKAVKQSLEPAAVEPAGTLVPHLDQLTDDELEELLRSEAGGTQ